MDEINEEETLIDLIQEEIRKVKSIESRIANNVRGYEGNVPQDTITKYLRIDDLMSSVLEQRMLAEGSTEKINYKKDYLEGLKQELKCLQIDLTKLTKRINEYEEEAQRLETFQEHMANDLETYRSEAEYLNVNDIEKNVIRRFKKEKTDLQAMIQILFGDDAELQNLFATITEVYYKEGPDKWATLEKTDDKVFVYIESLLRTGIFKEHPHDPLKIKMVNLL